MEESFGSTDGIASLANGGCECLTFSVGDEEYACDILSVQEIRAMTQITPIPNAPDYVSGVMNLRGIVVPVVSMRRMLGLPESENGKFRVIVIVTVGVKIVGLLVDAVSDVLRLRISEVPLPVEFGNRADASIVSALGTSSDDEFIVVLDVPSVAERAGLGPARTS
jgi:purine-binding chemotaxis protein CheW